MALLVRSDVLVVLLACAAVCLCARSVVTGSVQPRTSVTYVINDPTDLLLTLSCERPADVDLWVADANIPATSTRFNLSSQTAGDEVLFVPASYKRPLRIVVAAQWPVEANFTLVAESNLPLGKIGAALNYEALRHTHDVASRPLNGEVESQTCDSEHEPYSDEPQAVRHEAHARTSGVRATTENGRATKAQSSSTPSPSATSQADSRHSATTPSTSHKSPTSPKHAQQSSSSSKSTSTSSSTSASTSKAGVETFDDENDPKPARSLLDVVLWVLGQLISIAAEM